MDPEAAFFALVSAKGYEEGLKKGYEEGHIAGMRAAQDRNVEAHFPSTADVEAKYINLPTQHNLGEQSPIVCSSPRDLQLRCQIARMKSAGDGYDVGYAKGYAAGYAEGKEQLMAAKTGKAKAAKAGKAKAAKAGKAKAAKTGKAKKDAVSA